MRTSLWLALILVLPAVAQDKGESWVGVPLGNGKTLRLSTEATGVNGQTLAMRATISRSQHNLFHRVLLDSASQVIFAYDLEISDTASLPLEVQLKPVAADHGRMPASSSPTFSSARTIVLRGPGERATVELLMNPQTHHKIVDLLEIVNGLDASGSASGGVAGALPSRELSLSQVDLFEDGVKLTPSSANAIRGRVVMLYLPDKGGFFFTRDDPKGYGFLKIGSVDGNRVKFIWAGHTYECVSATPILADEGDRQLWVYLDPHYQPRRPAGFPPAVSRFQYGAADSAKLIFH